MPLGPVQFAMIRPLLLATVPACFLLILFNYSTTRISSSSISNFVNSKSTFGGASGLAYKLAWSIAQWIPAIRVDLPYSTSLDTRSIRNRFEENAWIHFEKVFSEGQQQRGMVTSSFSDEFSEEHIEIPTVDIQAFRRSGSDHSCHLEGLLAHLETTFGKDWRRRPLLMKGLWSRDELHLTALPNATTEEIRYKSNISFPSSERRLSYEGLLKEEMEIAYYFDSRIGRFSPDHRGSIKDIVYNMTSDGGNQPHKIGTRFFADANPELIREVAPHDTITELFGNHFEPDSLLGSGPFGWFPATTVMSIFVANPIEKLITDFHCEPTGNLAVQLSGQKRWTFVQPEFSWLLKPSIARNGRPYVMNNLKPKGPTGSIGSERDDVDTMAPKYTVIVEAGDAVWIPAWTWHKVDYLHSDDDVLCISATLLHFHLFEAVRNNPLFAFLVIPNLIVELLGPKDI